MQDVKERITDVTSRLFELKREQELLENELNFLTAQWRSQVAKENIESTKQLLTETHK